MNFRSPNITVGLLPIVRHDLRHAVQDNWSFALHELRIRLMPNGSSCLDFSNSSVPEFTIPSEPGFGFGEAVMINHRLHPGISRTLSAD